MIITTAQLKKIIPFTKESVINEVVPLLNDVFIKYEINTSLRVQHFLAQVIHESGGFRYNEEIASGAAYEGRKDLGNIIPGDGKRFKGRGFIQLTGRNNYSRYSKYIKVDVVAKPELVAITYKADVAGWFWTIEKNLNRFADADDVTTITKRINGGLNGLADRIKYLNLAKKHII